MKKTLILFSLFVLSIFTNLSIEKSYGRKPAVLPVSGISIDDVEPRDPAQTKGYNFGPENYSVAIGEKLVKRSTSSIDRKEIKASNSSDLVPALILFLVLLPIGLWVSLKKASLSKVVIEDTGPQEVEHTAEVVELRPKKTNSQQKRDISKAS